MAVRMRADALEAESAPAREAAIPVGPLAIFDGTLAGAADRCVEAITSGRGARIATANLDFVALARRDATLREDLANSTLVVADGKPIVWLARIAGARRIGRVNGVDLATELLRRGEALGGMRVALYGSTPDISRDAAAWIERTCAGVRIVARLIPPFRELSEQESLAERARLTAAAPDLVLVALGCPRQERLIARYFDAAPGAVWIGVGGTLDFFAGRRWRAPRFVQAAGIEWAFRLMQEPRRLWRRYLLRDLPTLFAIAPGCVRTRLARRPEHSPSTLAQPPINGDAAP